VTHHTTAEFWQHYRQLPPHVQRLAKKNYQLLESDPCHPSLHFKRIGRLWSVRIGHSYRALAPGKPNGIYGSGSATTAHKSG
jgi:hypothetical protein